MAVYTAPSWRGPYTFQRLTPVYGEDPCAKHTHTHTASGLFNFQSFRNTHSKQHKHVRNKSSALHCNLIWCATRPCGLQVCVV
jgi:hypothetical protein